MLFTINVANTIFEICLGVGGVLLLITVLLDDVLGGLLDWMHIDFDMGGVSLMPMVLAFIAMFGAGGLTATQGFQMGPGGASLVGTLVGLSGSGLVYGMFSVLKRAEAPQAFSLRDLIGTHGRVSVSIRAGKSGSVLLSYAGSSHDLTASADIDIAAGSAVTVDDAVGNTLIVRPSTPATGGTT